MSKRRKYSQKTSEKAVLVIFLGLSAVMVLLVGAFLLYKNITHNTKASAQVGPDTVPPTAPANLKVVGNLAAARDGGSRDDLTWTAAVDDRGVASYIVYQMTGGYAMNIAEVKGTSYSKQFAVDGYATDYSYYVIAKDASGNISPKSNIAHMTGIWGDILDNANGRYVRGAKIAVTGASGFKGTYYANYSGAYLIDLVPGDYSVEYSASGYVSQTWPLTVTENQLTTRNVFLKKARK